MERVKFIDHNGTQILLIDFSDSKPEDIMESIEHSSRVIQSQPAQSLRTLTYVKNARFNRRVTQALKEYTRANKPHVRAAAIVGLSGLMEVILHGIVVFTRRSFSLFDDIEQAKEWLARN